MLQSRQLTEAGDSTIVEKRMNQVHELRDLLRRLELIRAISVTSRGN